jgi:hypothetical protein
MVKRIVKIFMYLVGFLWIISACSLDSPTWLPFIVNVVCTAILAFYAYLNNWFYDYKYKED